MNFQSKPVAGAVEKSRLPSIADFGRITTIHEKLLHFLVQLEAINAGLHLFQCQRLAIIDRFPEPALLVAGATAHYRSRHVAVVAAGRGARENIEDDKAVRFQRPVAAFVRIARLIAPGHDRVRRQTPGAQNGGVDFRAQNAPRSGRVPDHSSFCPFPGFDRFSTSIPRAIPVSVISRALRIRRSSDSDFASRSGQKRPLAGWSRIFLDSSSRAYPSGKFAGTTAERTFLFDRKCAKHLLVIRGLGTRPLHLFFKLAVGQNLVGLGLFASAIDFEIAQDERSPAILLEKNKGIGREEPCGVKHVRVILACRDDQAGLVFFVFRLHRNCRAGASPASL